MFSLSTISVFATLAFSALTSALPLAHEEGPNILPAVPNVSDAVSTPAVVPRGGPVGLAEIFVTATAEITVAIQPLVYVTPGNATYEACHGPVQVTLDILAKVLVDVKLLIGQPLDVILCVVGGTVRIAVYDLAVIIAGLLCVVFEAIGCVLKIAGAAIDAVLFGCFCQIAALIAEILVVVLSLVGSIAAELIFILLGLLGRIIHIVLKLKVEALITVLAIKL